LFSPQLRKLVVKWACHLDIPECVNKAVRNFQYWMEQVDEFGKSDLNRMWEMRFLINLGIFKWLAYCALFSLSIEQMLIWRMQCTALLSEKEVKKNGTFYGNNTWTVMLVVKNGPWQMLWHVQKRHGFSTGCKNKLLNV